ncbi:hypothetical protein AA14337_2955 [Acetobacter malorum DSM 14337]|uniref:EthD domain-containing protein n=1 Tax=Acetobacter malorum DSM 14337 TaxID=1307910 RepID=A0ABQ0PYR6_9PROT|nr:hypothetical protein [Acetobacter malorum]KXV06742.1 hypothetical protein AD930_06480 [Acetobacter malorum]GBQ84949.1 hypothetical protein AA14337_2955 [Acetobacter malorum DSM 14337]
MTTDAEAEREAPRLFIRAIGRISDATDNAAFSKRFDGAFCNPDIAESLTMYVPVAPEDTYGATKGVIRKKVAMLLRDERASSAPSARLALGEGGVPYSEKEWDAAIKSFSRLHRDTERTDPGAAPFNDGRGYWPTHLVVQVIPVDDENAAFDLYMECLNRIARGERGFAEQVPESYLGNDHTFVCPDGTVFSRDAPPANVEGAVLLRDLITGDHELPETEVEVEMAPSL